MQSHVARIDINRSNGDAMFASVVDQLCGFVEAHRQAVDDGCCKLCRIPALEPGGDISKQGEAGGVGFGETILAETLDLFVNLVGEFGRKAGSSRPLRNLSRYLSIVPLRFQAAIDRRN